MGPPNLRLVSRCEQNLVHANDNFDHQTSSLAEIKQRLDGAFDILLPGIDEPIIEQQWIMALRSFGQLRVSEPNIGSTQFGEYSDIVTSVIKMLVSETEDAPTTRVQREAVLALGSFSSVNFSDSSGYVQSIAFQRLNDLLRDPEIALPPPVRNEAVHVLQTLGELLANKGK